MKYLNQVSIIYLMVFCFACTSNSNQNKTNDDNQSSNEFTDLGNDENFVDQHVEPSTIDYKAKGKMVTIDVSDGEKANIYQLKHENSHKYLLVFHEWWGLNDYILNESDQLFDSLQDVNVFALDLYDGKVANTREKAKEYMQGAKEERINAIINAVLQSLPADAQIATLGWCFGGGWSLKASILANNRAAGCVMYYGMPIDDKEKLSQLSTDVLFIYGTKDEWINEQVANEFKKNMKEVGKELTVLAFEADHAFANPTSERYVNTAAQAANTKSLNYLRQKLK